jgi:hypothetical protein
MIERFLFKKDTSDMVFFSDSSTHRFRSRVGHLIAGVLLAVLVVSCDNAAPAAAPTAEALLLPSELTQSVTDTGREVSVVGYLLADATGVVLVDNVMFETGGQPRPIGDTGIAIWLGQEPPVVAAGALRSAGSQRYAVAVVRGSLKGPASFGPRASYRYQIVAPQVAVLPVQETSMAALLEQPAHYEGQAVRLVGGLLVRDGAALLVDQLGTGGLPAPKARQIKLRAPLNDAGLLDRLAGAPGGAVRFGQVQIEGLWRAGALAPLSISVVG